MNNLLQITSRTTDQEIIDFVENPNYLETAIYNKGKLLIIVAFINRKLKSIYLESIPSSDDVITFNELREKEYTLRVVKDKDEDYWVSL